MGEHPFFNLADAPLLSMHGVGQALNHLSSNMLLMREARQVCGNRGRHSERLVKDALAELIINSRVREPCMSCTMVRPLESVLACRSHCDTVTKVAV